MDLVLAIRVLAALEAAVLMVCAGLSGGYYLYRLRLGGSAGQRRSARCLVAIAVGHVAQSLLVLGTGADQPPVVLASAPACVAQVLMARLVIEQITTLRG